MNNRNGMAPPPPSTRTRVFWWLGLIALMLLVPTIAIPLALEKFRQPAFESLADLRAADIRSLELFILQRPDGGDDIGGTRGMFAVPEGKFAEVLAPLQRAEPMTAEQPRGIWLGRMLVKLHDGRRQTVMFHRPRSDGGPAGLNRVEIRIGSRQYLGPDVTEFTSGLDRILGLVVPKNE